MEKSEKIDIELQTEYDLNFNTSDEQTDRIFNSLQPAEQEYVNEMLDKSLKALKTITRIYEESIKIRKMSLDDFSGMMLQGLEIKCPDCESFNWTDVKKFNLMFETKQ